MRFIPIDKFTPTRDWQQRATKATAQLLEKTTIADRLDYISKHGDIWRDFGRELRDCFGNKCWYTDASNYGARLDVEHFRPKAKTIELTTEDCLEAQDELLLKLPDPRRDGYWWLAFDNENLLLCAQVMNREEKKNFFPLHRTSPVATEANKHDWRNEIPVFLDPRKLADVCLVDYDDTGGMRPRSGLNQWERLRVAITDQCFGLSRFQPLVEGRQRVWQRCSDLIERYIRAAAKQLQDDVPNPVLEQEKNGALRDLLQLLNPDEQFSTVAASFLRNSPHEWARNLAGIQFPSPPRQAPHGGEN